MGNPTPPNFGRNTGSASLSSGKSARGRQMLAAANKSAESASKEPKTPVAYAVPAALPKPDVFPWQQTPSAPGGGHVISGGFGSGPLRSPDYSKGQEPTDGFLGLCSPPATALGAQGFSKRQGFQRVYGRSNQPASLAVTPARGPSVPARLSFAHPQHPPLQERQEAARKLPSGLLNLGNTCYMNAVLQVLLSLRPFAADLATLRNPEPDGVVAALQACAATKAATDQDSQGRSAFSPRRLKSTMDRRVASFQGGLQQDSHEFLCTLLEQVQREVLAAEAAAAGGGPQVAISATACPASRNFGFCVEHQARLFHNSNEFEQQQGAGHTRDQSVLLRGSYSMLLSKVTCGTCGKETRLQEQYMHLSMELPAGAADAGRLPHVPHVTQLLTASLKEEEVTKDCEGCGAEGVLHVIRHVLRRLPRVLVLQLKRFQVSFSSGGAPHISKLNSPVAAERMLRVGALTDAATRPALPLRGAASATLSAASAPSPLGPPLRLPPAKAPPPRDTAEGAAKAGASADAPLLLDGDLDLDQILDGEDAALQAALAASLAEAPRSPTAAAQSSPTASPISPPRPAARSASPAVVAPPREPVGGVKRSPADAGLAQGGRAVADERKAASGAAESVPPMIYTQQCWEVVEDPEPRSPTAARPLGQYRLHAKINHLGTGPTSGHFTADILDATSHRWLRHNDSLVSELPPQSGEQPDSDCYMLVYVDNAMFGV